MSSSQYWECINCGEKLELQFDSCWKCGTSRTGEISNKNSVMELEDLDYNINQSDVILTTAPYLEGYKVDATLEVITSECVYGLNLFSDFFSSMRDTFGGRSKTTQKALRKARRTCLEELKKEASEIGANAVIAIDLDYSEFSGKGKSMLFIVASGTAVHVSKVSSQSSQLPNPLLNSDDAYPK